MDTRNDPDDKETCKRIAPDSSIYNLARNSVIEASYIHFNDGYHYLVVPGTGWLVVVQQSGDSTPR